MRRIGMRIIPALVLLVIGSVVLAACGGEESNAPGKLNVVTTTTIIADMARNVGGEHVDVQSIVPANADPHSYEPTPREMRFVANADVVIEHGLDLDAWVSDMIDASETNAPVTIVTDGITPLAAAEHDHEDEANHDHGHNDPHVWFDVANAKIMVANIRDALIAADANHRAAYQANADTYLAELDDLDGWIREQIATIPEDQRKIVTNHDAFGYYVHAYGLTLIGTIIPSLDSQSQPSARDTAALIDAIKESGVKAIFTEAALNPALANQIANNAGVSVVSDLYGDSLGPDGSGADTYIGMMRTDTTRIVEALR